MATYREAVDEMLGRFKAQWDADTPAITGTVPPVYYPDTEDGTQEQTTNAFARVTVQHDDGGQRSLGGIGARIFENEGLITVQVFVPLAGRGGYSIAQALAEVAKAAFEGKSTPAVWFRNVRFNEIGPEGPFYQINVNADFVWHQQI